MYRIAPRTYREKSELRLGASCCVFPQNSLRLSPRATPLPLAPPSFRLYRHSAFTKARRYSSSAPEKNLEYQSFFGTISSLFFGCQDRFRFARAWLCVGAKETYYLKLPFVRNTSVLDGEFLTHLFCKICCRGICVAKKIFYRTFKKIEDTPEKT